MLWSVNTPAGNDEKSDKYLIKAFEWVTNVDEKLTNPDLRKSYLEDVPEVGTIQRAYKDRFGDWFNRQLEIFGSITDVLVLFCVRSDWAIKPKNAMTPKGVQASKWVISFILLIWGLVSDSLVPPLTRYFQHLGASYL